MSPEDFALWLNGFLAANSHLKELNAEQTRRIKDKLSTVFTKVTPTYEPNNQTFILGANAMGVSTPAFAPIVNITC